MEFVLEAQILLRQLRHGQVAGQVILLGHARAGRGYCRKGGAPSPLEFRLGEGYGERGGLLRLGCSKLGACGDALEGARAGGPQGLDGLEGWRAGGLEG